MLQSTSIKQRRRASLVLLGWLCMTLFSCSALSKSSGASPMAGSAHHAMMEMPGGEHDSMPCCEQLAELDCCEEITALHSSHASNLDATDKIELPVLMTLSSACPNHPVQAFWPSGTLADSHSLLPGYPRLHLLHCTFLD